jgi:hypothetical protein
MKENNYSPGLMVKLSCTVLMGVLCAIRAGAQDQTRLQRTTWYRFPRTRLFRCSELSPDFFCK